MTWLLDTNMLSYELKEDEYIMLNTVRATLSPQGTLRFEEVVEITQPVTVLVTLLDDALPAVAAPGITVGEPSPAAIPSQPVKDLEYRLSELRMQHARHQRQARTQALQTLLAWVDEATPPPPVPLEALDRGEIY